MVRTLAEFSLLAFALAVAACGGGGAGNSVGQSPTASSNAGAPGPPTPRSENVEFFGPLFGSSPGSLLIGCPYAGCVEFLSVDGVQVPATGFQARGQMAYARTTRAGQLSIDVHHAVIGPIGEIDSAAGRLTVLGQNVYVLDQTLTSEPGLIWPDLDQLQIGEFIAVSGAYTAAGDIYATHLSRVAPGRLLLRGILAAHDHGGLRIGALEVDLSAASLEGFPASAPLPGDPALLTAVGSWNGGALAVSAAQMTSRIWMVDEQQAGRQTLTGFVTASRSPDDFDVAGYRVDLRHCECELPSTAPAVGTPVMIDRGYGSTATVTLNLLTWRSTTVSGPVEGIDYAQGAITVLGISARVLPGTYIANDHVDPYALPLPGENLLMPLASKVTLGDIEVGEHVTVIGGVRGEHFVAGGVFRHDGNNTAWVGSILDVIEGETIRFLGLDILVDGATRISDCTYGACRAMYGPWLFDEAKVQYFPPTIEVVLDSPDRPLRAQAVRVWWTD